MIFKTVVLPLPPSTEPNRTSYTANDDDDDDDDYYDDDDDDDCHGYTYPQDVIPRICTFKLNIKKRKRKQKQKLRVTAWNLMPPPNGGNITPGGMLRTLCYVTWC